MQRVYLKLALFLCAAVIVGAQEPAPPPPPPHAFGGPEAFGPGMRHPKTIAGEPYSANITTTIDQSLPDGNTIHRVTQGFVARDGQGRVYSRQTFTGGPWAQNGSSGTSTVVFLTDPVAGYSYVLNQSTKTAIRRPLRQRSSDRVPPEGRGPRFDSANRVEKDLGTQSINGIECTGKSITHTLPAGTIGNAQPIVDKSEIWTASDLQIVVLSKHTDPRMGTSTYALSNVQRAEPDPSLFQVPAGYTVEDAPAHNR
ncbi:MAG TPA: hypothetical protein VKX25_22660 [Bryobacteraceae bacterium]|nr:hypothetical protein [Bryobacteraceae bacterium]